MNKLDQEEEEILEAFEMGELERVSNVKKQIHSHVEIAKNTFKKDARINIRITSKDLRSLQTRALMEGIPYQTFVSSILHKFINGQLVPK
ncbi:MAG: hypothetical protein QNK20_11670 [Aureibaculum sp.]|nr:hypothetical protein [Aureibaculum sp.]